mmetsp:Transcript_26436/g.63698  ORF Transcript_26436/g.63698 Transcript_26436/m.63698 type:complete len:243 (-) Transcript_26436:203-931(-)
MSRRGFPMPRSSAGRFSTVMVDPKSRAAVTAALAFASLDLLRSLQALPRARSASAALRAASWGGCRPTPAREAWPRLYTSWRKYWLSWLFACESSPAAFSPSSPLALASSRAVSRFFSPSMAFCTRSGDGPLLASAPSLGSLLFSAFLALSRMELGILKVTSVCTALATSMILAWSFFICSSSCFNFLFSAVSSSTFALLAANFSWAFLASEAEAGPKSTSVPTTFPSIPHSLAFCSSLKKC